MRIRQDFFDKLGRLFLEASPKTDPDFKFLSRLLIGGRRLFLSEIAGNFVVGRVRDQFFQQEIV